MRPDENYAFETEVFKSSVYYFSVDAQGRPLKLGDGSFGVVYQVYDETAELFAVKLLYKSQIVRRTLENLELTDGIIQTFYKKFSFQSNDQVIRQIENLRDLCRENYSDFVYELTQIDITKEQYQFLIEKIFYDSRSPAVRRFEDEIEAARKIRKKLEGNNETNANRFDGVIETLNGTKKFRESKAYSTLKGVFDETDIEVSDYALVMRLYDCTLKDLLENGINKYSIRQSPEVIDLFKRGIVVPKELQYLEKKEIENTIDSLTQASTIDKNTLKNNIYELVGYDVLEFMDFDERIATILPYLRRITVGMQTLYSVDFFHLDLKPANVFVKRLDMVDAVIGDLGFLEREEIVSSFTDLVDDAIPLGTRHFRSPEQKDYFDTCNVEIQQSDESGSVSLIVRDPKFQDTVIEEADYLIFSRDKTRHRYEIAQIKNTNNNLTIITLKSTQRASSVLKPDKQTQIVLYKRPGIRTDLFGIGAIAFDLITCGKSPEKFYDDIHAYDRKGKHIAEIMDVYRSVSSFQATDPGLAHIFSPFKKKNSSTYVPAQFIELILKCMFYKAEDTFYKEHQEKERQSGENKRHGDDAFAKVLSHLTDLGKEFEPKIINNPLVTNNYRVAPGDNKSVILFDRLKDLQQLSLEELPLRLAKGIWYFRELVELVRRTVSSESPFFSELLPNNISVTENGKLDFIYTTYKEEEDYIDDLREDLVYAKVTRNIANPYVPIKLAFLRRPIELKVVSEKSEASSQKSELDASNTFQYWFLDTTEYPAPIFKDDWVVINTHLFKVKKATHQEITLESNAKDGPKLSEIIDPTHDKFINCIYYRNLNPPVYYLNMLGIYLHQIFFIGLGNTTVDESGLVKIAQTRASMNPNAVLIADEWSEGRGFKPILQWITSMYLRLIFTQDKKSFYSQGKSDKDRIILVEGKTSILQDMIEEFIVERPRYLNDLVKDEWFYTPSPSGEVKREKLSRKYRRILAPFPANLELNSLIKSALFIELRDKPIRLDFPR